MLAALCANVPSDTVNLVLAHAMVHGGTMGGGERSAHTVFAYSVPTGAFPSNFHYVALGHLHRQQRLEGACPIHYSGSPLQLDFSETEHTKSVNLIEAAPRQPVTVDQVPLSSGKRLRKVKGRLAELERLAEQLQDDYLLVEVDEPQRPALADQVRNLLPNAVEVRLPPTEPPSPPCCERTEGPQELFNRYLKERARPNEQVEELFGKLLDEVMDADDAP